MDLPLHRLATVLWCNTYRIAGKIGESFNLEVWRTIRASSNLKWLRHKSTNSNFNKIIIQLFHLIQLSVPAVDIIHALSIEQRLQAGAEPLLVCIRVKKVRGEITTWVMNASASMQEVMHPCTTLT